MSSLAMRTTLVVILCLSATFIEAGEKPLSKEESSKAIEKVIRRVIGKPEGRLTGEDYKSIIELKLFDQGITDISSLSQLTNLK